jgi:Multiubiquitin
MTEGSKDETPVEKAIEHIEKAQADLAEAQQEEARAHGKEVRAEHELEEALDQLKEVEHREYPLKVNRIPHTWPKEEINGAQIKQLAGSPAGWVVNQTHDGPGEDPEVLDGQYVHLAEDAAPKGEKTFTTRKPKTSPGS